MPISTEIFAWFGSLTNARFSIVINCWPLCQLGGFLWIKQLYYSRRPSWAVLSDAPDGWLWYVQFLWLILDWPLHKSAWLHRLQERSSYLTLLRHFSGCCTSAGGLHLKPCVRWLHHFGWPVAGFCCGPGWPHLGYWPQDSHLGSRDQPDCDLK